MKYFDIHQHLNYGTDIDSYAREMRKLNMRAAVNSVGPMFAQPGNDLFDPAFWTGMNERHRAGDIVDIFPYRESKRFCKSLPQAR